MSFMDTYNHQILHILTASIEHGQLILQCGLQAGFRESGAVGLTDSKGDQACPMVAIRSMGLGFESIVGIESEGRRWSVISDEYAQALVHIANERFVENRIRTQRFREAFQLAIDPPPRKTLGGTEWEDPVVRRERKRAEGLKRAAELRKSGDEAPSSLNNVMPSGVD
jgi:tRNA wybutosine-synthesizing protein 3